MIEPPSNELLRRLYELRLCTPRDLRRCRRRVRSLAHDLPAFDSVWIDALLQARLLTPFQAGVLSSAEPDRLAVGPCVLLDELGRGPVSTTYLARRRSGTQPCVLKLIRPPAAASRPLQAEFVSLFERLRGFSHPSVVAPRTCIGETERLIVVSPYVRGSDLRQLLVRRGRFPWEVVEEIARQLLDGLSALEQRGVVHGDIRASKVRLTDAGTAVLIDVGLGVVLLPELTIHQQLPLDRCDVLAPELIGTGRAATPASDMYSLGCLLWELLAGRPVFPAGDPLAKLAAHQKRNVPDVRTIAPDAPERLACLIRALTDRNPQARPSSVHEVCRKFGPPQRAGRRRLRRFKASFNTTLPAAPRAARTAAGSWPSLAAAMLFALSGLSLALLDAGARNQLLRWAQPALAGLESVRGRSGVGEVVPQDPVRGGRRVSDGSAVLEPLPGPNAEGVIELPSAGPFAPAEIHAVGPLTIRGTSAARAVIVADGGPLNVTATRLTLEHLEVRGHGASAGPLVAAHVQQLHVRQCAFHSDPESIGPQVAAAIDWKLLDRSDRSGGAVLQDVVFGGGRDAVRVHPQPGQVRATNCLKLHRGALFAAVADERVLRDAHYELTQVTLRGATALLDLHLTGQRPLWGHVELAVNDCLFDLTDEHAALARVLTRHAHESLIGMIRVRGAGSVAAPGLRVAAHVDADARSAAELNERLALVEGLAVGEFEFAGPPDPDPRNSELAHFAGPRLSVEPPGIDAKRLSPPASP